jgi:hypothetical protein
MKIQLITAAFLFTAGAINAQSTKSDSIQLQKNLAKKAEFLKQQEEKAKKATEVIYTKEQLAAFKKTQDSLDALNAIANAERAKRMNAEQDAAKLNIAKKFTADSIAAAAKSAKDNEAALLIENANAEKAAATVVKQQVKEIKTEVPSTTIKTEEATNNFQPSAKDLEARRLEVERLSKSSEKKVDKNLLNMQRHAQPNELDVAEFNDVNKVAKKIILNNTYQATMFNRLPIAADVYYLLEFANENSINITRNTQRITTAYSMPSMYLKIDQAKFTDEDPQAYNCEITNALENVLFVQVAANNEIILLDKSYIEVLKLKKK